MKKLSIIRLLTSFVLMSLVSAAMYAVAGVPPVYTMAGLMALGALKTLTGLSFSEKGLALDGFVVSDTTYAGEVAAAFAVKAMTGNDTVQGGHVYVKDGIKKKFTIPRFDANYEDFIQDRAATPVSQGDMTITGNVLEPADYMIYTEFNPRDFEAHWYAIQLNETLIDRRLPMTVESVVVQEVLKRHDRYLNRALWRSDTSLSTVYKYWNGFIKKAASATTGSDQTNIVGSPTTLSSVNIVAELAKGYALIPIALRNDPALKIFMNPTTAQHYYDAQKAQAEKGVDFTQRGVKTYNGLPIVEIADLPNDFYFIAKASADMTSNMWVGMNSASDETLQLAKLQANSELYFIKMLMKVDVQFGWFSETVLYGTN